MLVTAVAEQSVLTMSLGITSESAIPRQSLTSAVADKLRDQIIRGEIAEGTQLRQDAIATQYRISRIPVREALRQLDAEGLITIVPNRGAVVPALSPDDIEELFSIRALIEPEILKRSIPHLTEGDFSEAERVLRTYVSELRRDDRGVDGLIALRSEHRWQRIGPQVAEQHLHVGERERSAAPVAGRSRIRARRRRVEIVTRPDWVHECSRSGISPRSDRAGQVRQCPSRAQRSLRQSSTDD